MKSSKNADNTWWHFKQGLKNRTPEDLKGLLYSYDIDRVKCKMLIKETRREITKLNRNIQLVKTAYKRKLKIAGQLRAVRRGGLERYNFQLLLDHKVIPPGSGWKFYHARCRVCSVNFFITCPVPLKEFISNHQLEDVVYKVAYGRVITVEDPVQALRIIYSGGNLKSVRWRSKGRAFTGKRFSLYWLGRGNAGEQQTNA